MTGKMTGERREGDRMIGREGREDTHMLHHMLLFHTHHTTPHIMLHGIT
jgi:hypothetical protein